MCSDLIEATRNEVLRLIDKQSEILHELLTINNLLPKSSGDRQQGIDSQTVINWQNALGYEKKKVESLEMVLGVVGIMNAGKSTTINAITGSEILPNRNQPMTTLPTLIRHCKGKKDPVLSFMKRQPVEEMLNEVKKKLKELKQADKLDVIDLNNEKDCEGLINNILNNKYGYFKEHYEGQKQIFEFLKSLNDLVRLAQSPNINIEFPIEKYENLNDLPFIEVEFIHLANLQQVDRATISLLDTPGPNEYGQGDKLRKIWNAQIDKASAVLMIVDYNNLKTKDEGEIRDRLKEQTGLIADRLFIIVNKFDMKKTNSMLENEVKQYVAGSLMQGKISQERVYPASAHNGYLANRAKQEIDKNGNLPDDDENGWVDDFGKAAFGSYWDEVKSDKDQNIEQIKSQIPKLWTNSMFEKPLKEAIVKASETATLFSMQSATAKMLDLYAHLNNFLEASGGTLTKTEEKNREIVNELEKSIEKVNQAEIQAGKQLQHQLGNFFESTKILYDTIKKELIGTLEIYFKHGKLQEEFESEQEAKNFAERINQEINSLVSTAEQNIEKRLTELSKDLQRKIHDVLFDNVGEILEKAKQKLEGDGFLVNFFIPEPNTEQNKIDFSSLVLASIEYENKEAYNYVIRKKEGFLRGTLKRGAGEFVKGTTLWFYRPKWGYEELSIKKSESSYVSYIVDLEKLRINILEDLENIILDLSSSNHIFFETAAKPIINNYFDELKNYLSEFRGTMLNSINKHRLDEQAIQELMQSIINVKKKVISHNKYVVGIDKGLKELK